MPNKINYALAKSLYKGQWAVSASLLSHYHPLLTGLMSGYDIEVEEKGDYTPECVHPGSRETQKSFDEAPEGSIAIFSLSGPMMKADSLSSFGTETIASHIAIAGDHKNISGSIIKIDSGGGAVDSIAPMRDAIQRHQAKKKPVVALADMAASAAYYAAIYCDEIMADNDISSEFGSIGVVVGFADSRPYFESLGVKFHTIYAPESTHKNKEFEEALKGKYQLMKQETLSPLAKGFQKNVRDQRQGKVNLTVDGILNGRMFYAHQARDYGLIDSIGSMDAAIQRVIKLSSNYQ